MKTNNKAKRSHSARIVNEQVHSLMSSPLPVFVTDREGRVIPTITLPEFQRLARYME
jgi:hypothetical protein